jgi:hypothetical protein
MAQIHFLTGISLSKSIFILAVNLELGSTVMGLMFETGIPR